MSSSSTPSARDLAQPNKAPPLAIEHPARHESTPPYLAVGSLTVHPQKPCESPEVWTSLPANLEVSRVANSPLFSPLAKLLCARWVQADFKLHNFLEKTISVRIFILPDDIGRSTILREDLGLRKAMWELICSLDKSVAGWKGDGSISHPVIKYPSDSTYESLFHIFNTLQDPKPEPKVVTDVFSRDAMETLLDLSEGVRGLRSKLFNYQRRSAALMIQREVQPAKLLDPRFMRRIGPTGEVFYLDERAGCVLSEKREFDEARGGILAETMGIGKTLICLAVILSTKGHWPKIPPQYSIGQHPVRPKVGTLMEMAAATVARHYIPWKAAFEKLARAGEHYDRCVEALQSHTIFYSLPPKVSRVRVPSKQLSDMTIRLCSATLVIVPANLLAQWKHEISLHVEAGFLSVLTVDSLVNAMPTSSQLAQYDIVLMERKRFEREIMSERMPSHCISADNAHANDMTSPTSNPTKGRSSLVQRSTEVFAGCNCSWANFPHSPLKCLHFLRLIVDEGHNFAASHTNSNSASCMHKLHVDRRWIVSGTPANGLLGAEVELAARESCHELTTFMDPMEVRAADRMLSAFTQEAKDLKSLGNIVINFLALPPWANMKHGPDHVSWDWYVAPSKDGGERDSRTLRNVLASLVVRHRLDTVGRDIQLPQLHNRVVYLRPCFFDKASINLFLLKLTSNAITSERVDRDYMFHASNRKQLDKLISNLRQSCFFWTGFTAEDVFETVRLSRAYVEAKRNELNKDDVLLMESAVEAGMKPLKSFLWHALTKLDEIGLYVRDFPAGACETWSLTRTNSSFYCVIGATQLGRAVNFVDDRLYMTDPTEGLSQAGKGEMEKAERQATKQPKSKAKSISTSISPQKIKTKASRSQSITPQGFTSTGVNRMHRKPLTNNEAAKNHAKESSRVEGSGKYPNSALKPTDVATPPPLRANSSLSRTRLVGTVSAKLSYLLDRVIEFNQREKILIFYEGDHIAYYVAQALELIGVQHLIYANSLEVGRRNHYMITFTTTETFRVMLMDLRQAAHGLHVACASRVFFINPVWQPNIEAQAIKRAHRIGQTRPVHVETLVLEDTLEDMMLQRRKTMTAREQQKASKSLLDDSTMNDIIKNAQVIPFLDQELGDESSQFAPLKFPQQLFGRETKNVQETYEPERELVVPQLTDAAQHCPEHGRKRVVLEGTHHEASSLSLLETVTSSKRRKVTFAA